MSDSYRVRSIVGDVLASEPDDAATRSYAGMSAWQKSRVDERAAEAGMTTADYLQHSDAERIAQLAATAEAQELALATRRPRS